MSADLLRRAASLMRERAEAATPGPWRFTDAETVADVWDGGLVVVNPNRDPIANVSDQWYESDPDEPAPVDDARHIASWHPAVALAVAGASNWIANFIVTITFPSLSAFSLSAAYGLYALMSLLSFFFVVRRIRETKGVELEAMTDTGSVQKVVA